MSHGCSCPLKLEHACVSALYLHAQLHLSQSCHIAQRLRRILFHAGHFALEFGNTPSTGLKVCLVAIGSGLQLLFIYIHICIDTYIHVYIYMCVTCAYMYTYIHINIYLYMCLPAEPYIHIYTCVCIYEYLLSCIYIYTHTVVCIPSELPHRTTRPFSSLCCQPLPPLVLLHAEVRYTRQIAI